MGEVEKVSALQVYHSFFCPYCLSEDFVRGLRISDKYCACLNMLRHVLCVCGTRNNACPTCDCHEARAAFTGSFASSRIVSGVNGHGTLRKQDRESGLWRKSLHNCMDRSHSREVEQV